MTGRRGSDCWPWRARSRSSRVMGTWPASASQRICAAKAAGLTQYLRKPGAGRGVTSWYMRIGTLTAAPSSGDTTQILIQGLAAPDVGLGAEMLRDIGPGLLA